MTILPPALRGSLGFSFPSLSDSRSPFELQCHCQAGRPFRWELQAQHACLGCQAAQQQSMSGLGGDVARPAFSLTDVTVTAWLSPAGRATRGYYASESIMSLKERFSRCVNHGLELLVQGGLSRRASTPVQLTGPTLRPQVAASRRGLAGYSLITQIRTRIVLVVCFQLRRLLACPVFLSCILYPYCRKSRTRHRV